MSGRAGRDLAFGAGGFCLVGLVVLGLIAWKEFGSDLFEEPPTFWEQADRAREEGDLDKAEELLREGLAAEPDDQYLREDLGKLLAEQGEIQAAIQVYEGFPRDRYRPVQVSLALAELSARLGDRNRQAGELAWAVDCVEWSWFQYPRRRLAEIERLHASGGLDKPGLQAEAIQLRTSAGPRATCSPPEVLIGGGCDGQGRMLTCLPPAAPAAAPMPGWPMLTRGGAFECEQGNAFALCWADTPGGLPAERPLRD